MQLIPLTEHFIDLEIHGPEAETFLQGQLTCDVTRITETHLSLAAHCNVKGRVVSLGHLYRMSEGFRWTLPIATLPGVKRHLQTYARFAKVTLTEAQPMRCGVIDPQNLSIPVSAVGSIRKEKGHGWIRHLGSVPRYEVLGMSVSELAETWSLSQGNSVSFEAWQAAQIRAEEPFLSPETQGEFLPHDLNLPALGAVSFQKGCYLGQEIVARMEHLGKTVKQMRCVTLPEAMRPAVLEEIIVNGFKGKLLAKAVDQESAVALVVGR